MKRENTRTLRRILPILGVLALAFVIASTGLPATNAQQPGAGSVTVLTPESHPLVGGVWHTELDIARRRRPSRSCAAEGTAFGTDIRFRRHAPNRRRRRHPAARRWARIGSLLFEDIARGRLDILAPRVLTDGAHGLLFEMDGFRRARADNTASFASVTSTTPDGEYALGDDHRHPSRLHRAGGPGDVQHTVTVRLRRRHGDLRPARRGAEHRHSTPWRAGTMPWWPRATTTACRSSTSPTLRAPRLPPAWDTITTPTRSSGRPTTIATHTIGNKHYDAGRRLCRRRGADHRNHHANQPLGSSPPARCNGRRHLSRARRGPRHSHPHDRKRSTTPWLPPMGTDGVQIIEITIANQPLGRGPRGGRRRLSRAGSGASSITTITIGSRFH